MVHRYRCAVKSNTHIFCFWSIIAAVTSIYGRIMVQNIKQTHAQTGRSPNHSRHHNVYDQMEKLFVPPSENSRPFSHLHFTNFVRSFENKTDWISKTIFYLLAEKLAHIAFLSSELSMVFCVITHIFFFRYIHSPFLPSYSLTVCVFFSSNIFWMNQILEWILMNLIDFINNKQLDDIYNIQILCQARQNTHPNIERRNERDGKKLKFEFILNLSAKFHLSL